MQCSVVLLFLNYAQPVLAHADHDHDAPALTNVTASPRLDAHSELFEIVGVLDNKRFMIYLDRYATNEPVTDAKIEVEATGLQDGKSATVKGFAAASSDGSFEWKDHQIKPGSEWAVTFTVVVGNDSDLLVGTLKLPRAGTDSDVQLANDHGAFSHLPKALSPKLLAVIAIAFAVLIFFLIFSRLSRKKRNRITGALPTVVVSLGLLGFTALSIFPTMAVAGGDHGKTIAAIASNAPKRQSDGSVFFPKPSQRELEIRTTSAQIKEVAKTIELSGRVLADPSAGGKVQTANGGRVDATVAGLPRLGQKVRKGEVLAIIRPTTAPFEKADRSNMLAETKTNLELAKRKLERLEQLEGSVPQRDIEAARAEVSLLSQRAVVTQGSLIAVETLVAPISGVIANVAIVTGQVVSANETLFEVIDPTQLYIEALAYDTGLFENLETTAFTSVGAKSITLSYIGRGKLLKEQAVPLQFRVVASKDSGLLSVGQPVTVKAKSTQAIKAVLLNASSIVKNPSNQDIVWVHSGAEVFVPRTIRWQAVDGETVAVMSGLSDGDRVVVRSASLLNQVR